MSDPQRLAPRPGVALALGSGGARGLAHIGILRIMRLAGVQVRGVAGSSIGAVVGGLHCAEVLERYETFMRGMDRQSVVWFLDPVLPTSGIFGGRRLDALMRELVGDRSIEVLPIEFCAVACDASTGAEIRLQTGELATAMRASYAIPGLLRPQRVDGRWLTDGGAVAPVPVAAARSLGYDHVVAVDLHGESFRPDDVAKAAPAEQVSESEEPDLAEPRWNDKAVRFWRQLRRRSPDGPPGLPALISDSMAIVQLHLARYQLADDPPELLLQPRLPDVGLFDFDAADRIIAEGERVAREAWEAGAFEPLLRAQGLGERVRKFFRAG